MPIKAVRKREDPVWLFSLWANAVEKEEAGAALRNWSHQWELICQSSTGLFPPGHRFSWFTPAQCTGTFFMTPSYSLKSKPHLKRKKKTLAIKLA